MKTFQLHTFHKDILADTITPVGVYLKLRDKFANSILLESSDYQAGNNSFSYICCDAIASIKVENGKIIQNFPDGSILSQTIDPKTNVMQAVQEFSSRFQMTKT